MSEKNRIRCEIIPAFKDVVFLFKEFIGEIKIKFTREGLHTAFIDDGRIALAVLEIPKEDFWSYEIDADVVEEGINVRDLSDVLTRLNENDEKIGIAIPCRDKDKEVIVSFSREDCERIFALSAIQLGDQGINPAAMDKILYRSICEFDPDAFLEMVLDAEVFGAESMEFIYKKGTVTAKADGSARGRTLQNIKMRTDEVDIPESVYAMKYVKPIAQTCAAIKKATGTENRITFRFDYETPGKFQMRFFKNSVLTFYVAPRLGEKPEEKDDY